MTIQFSPETGTLKAAILKVSITTLKSERVEIDEDDLLAAYKSKECCIEGMVLKFSNKKQYMEPWILPGLPNEPYNLAAYSSVKTEGDGVDELEAADFEWKFESKSDGRKDKINFNHLQGTTVISFFIKRN